MTRMFKLDGQERIRTWNPCKGCQHGCYRGRCWAAQMAVKLQQQGRAEAYKTGFELSRVPSELAKAERLFGNRRPQTVFVGAMGDLWAYSRGDWVISEVLQTCRRYPWVRWFFETKVPSRYTKFLQEIPKNAILSTTIETNRTYRLCEGPVQPDPVEKRLEAMQALIGRGWQNVHISIEPIVDFDPAAMENWMGDIHARVKLRGGKQLMVSVGYDNYSIGLPEPELTKTERLIKTMEENGIFVERKVLREKIPQKGEW